MLIQKKKEMLQESNRLAAEEELFEFNYDLRDLEMQREAAKDVMGVRCPLCRGVLVVRMSHQGPHYCCRCGPEPIGVTLRLFSG